MREPGRLHRTATLVMSLLMAAVGVAIIVTTIASGGGPLAVGVLLGALFVLAGGGRFWVTWND